MLKDHILDLRLKENESKKVGVLECDSEESMI
jgi:hypothetical protein